MDRRSIRCGECYEIVSATRRHQESKPRLLLIPCPVISCEIRKIFCGPNIRNTNQTRGVYIGPKIQGKNEHESDGVYIGLNIIKHE